MPFPAASGLGRGGGLTPFLGLRGAGRGSIAAFLAAALLPACCRPEGARPPLGAAVVEGTRISEDWHRLLLNGSPAGFNHEVVSADARGNVTSRGLQRLVVSRLDQ